MTFCQHSVLFLSSVVVCIIEACIEMFQLNALTAFHHQNHARKKVLIFDGNLKEFVNT